MVAIDDFNLDVSDDIRRDIAFLLVILSVILLILVGLLFVNGYVVNALFKIKYAIESRKAHTRRSNFGERARFARNPNVKFFVDPEDAEQFEPKFRARHSSRGGFRYSKWVAKISAVFYRRKDALDVDMEMAQVKTLQVRDGQFTRIKVCV